MLLHLSMWHMTVSDNHVVTALCFSGGNKLEVRGANLNNVQKPQFIVYVSGTNRTAV